jgi:glucokinase
MTGSCAIALDVGGSSIKSGYVARGNHTVAGFRTDPINSYGSSEEIITTLTGVIYAQIEQIRTARLSGVGIGFPGPFDYAEGICRMQGISPIGGPGSRGKFDTISGLNLRDELRHRLDLLELEIKFRNDAEAAIVGEAKYGSGRGYHRLIGITLGTGMGSAFLIDGVRLTAGAGVPPGGWLFKEPVADLQADDVFSTRGMLSRLAQEGVEFSSVKQAALAARGGEEAALHAFRAFGAELGSFLRPFTIAFAAESVLVLGGIANAFDLFSLPLGRELPAPALSGVLGAHAGLLGAVEELDPF